MTSNFIAVNVPCLHKHDRALRNIKKAYGILPENQDMSELVSEAVNQRLKPMIEKFPDLNSGVIRVTLEMQNSPVQAGPDLFTVTSHVCSGRYHGVRLKKSSQNLYVALNDLVDHMLEKLNRFGDKIRVKERTKARRIANFV